MHINKSTAAANTSSSDPIGHEVHAGGSSLEPPQNPDLARSVLVVDDDLATREMVEEMLLEAGFQVQTADSAAAAIQVSKGREFGAILTDLHMPGMDGLGLLAELRELRPETPVVLMTAFGSIETAVKAMRAGAFDYVTKPFALDTLIMALERSLEHRELTQENRRLRMATGRSASFGDLVGKSVAMNEIYAMIRKIANSRSNVLISGESGTGKEVVARTIHNSSARANKPMIPINCTAMPEGVLESELFGHARGAFTGAHAEKKGLFEAANGGTIFLDEIGDMPLGLQGKLLRVLQEREVRPVGSTQSIPITSRVIAATNRDLKEEVQAGTFREDLYYRLNVLPVHIPPLRERAEDIAPLVNAFLSKHSDGQKKVLSEAALRKLERAPWSGNARELENCIERALAMGDGKQIKASDLVVADDPVRSIRSIDSELLQLALERGMSLHDLGERYTHFVMQALNGCKSKAARLLGVNRRTLYRRKERLERDKSGEARTEGAH